MIDSVSLLPFEKFHLEPLTRWLATPAVARWYPQPNENLEWAAQPPPGGSQAIIAKGTHELGYVRWQRVDRETLDSLGLQEIPSNAVGIDIDILIGEEAHLHKGMGTTALQLLVDQLRGKGDVPQAGLSPEPDNAAAIRSYEKVGFRFRREYQVAGHTYSLMTLDLP